MCHNRFEDFQTRITNTISGYEWPARAAFLAGYERHYLNHLSVDVASALEKGVVVVVHIRRGDVLESKVTLLSLYVIFTHQFDALCIGQQVIDMKHRLTSFSIYEQILRKLLAVRRDGPNPTRPISIFLLAEGSSDGDSVLEYEEKDAHSHFMLNATSALLDVCNATESCQQRVLYSLSFFEAYTAMCEADVLITSTSGFAWVAGALCTPPMTVALPAWDNFQV